MWRRELSWHLPQLIVGHGACDQFLSELKGGHFQTSNVTVLTRRSNCQPSSPSAKPDKYIIKRKCKQLCNAPWNCNYHLSWWQLSVASYLGSKQLMTSEAMEHLRNRTAAPVEETCYHGHNFSWISLGFGAHIRTIRARHMIRRPGEA